jgi:hypothetical protein
MFSLRLFAALTAAAAAVCLAGCGSTSSGSGSGEKGTSAAESTSGSALSELVVPSADSDEANLGSYYLCDDGVKLYFNKDEFPEELALTFKKYFLSFGNNDYDSYLSCLYPSYAEEMEKYLQKEYSYDLKTSFSKQRDILRSYVSDKDYTITRLKLETPESSSIEGFFEYANECFGRDYLGEVKAQCNALYEAFFYLIVQADGEDHEDTIITECRIVFAEKDGKYYTFV